MLFISESEHLRNQISKLRSFWRNYNVMSTKAAVESTELFQVPSPVENISGGLHLGPKV